MDTTLKEAYVAIFGRDPPASTEDWQLADTIIENWDVPKIGENSAKQVIFRVVNHTHYPDNSTSQRVLGRALAFATELWNDLPDEPHVAQIEYKEFKDLGR